MAYDPGAIDATLAAAVGDDPALIVELRIAFIDSVQHAMVGLERADESTEWSAAAGRLKGLAASFGAVRLMALANEAVQADAPDPLLLGRIKRLAARL